MILDCGEDKRDHRIEYGHTAAFEEFRREETGYIENVIRHADSEYREDGVEYRLVIAYAPFSFQEEPPFDIEEPLLCKCMVSGLFACKRIAQCLKS